MNYLVYEFSTHSLNYTQGFKGEKYSLTLGFLELLFDGNANTLVGVQGFLPLIRAEKCGIEIPMTVAGIYKMPNGNVREFKAGQIYDFKVCGKSVKILRTRYDQRKGLIEIETNITDLQIKKPAIKVNKNLSCLVDETGFLQKLYVRPDCFRK